VIRNQCIGRVHYSQKYSQIAWQRTQHERKKGYQTMLASFDVAVRAIFVLSTQTPLRLDRRCYVCPISSPGPLLPSMTERHIHYANQ
jgi:hypothetical protein